MRILIDTNIFVYGESNEVTRSDVAKLVSLAMGHGITLMVHAASLEDIRRDKNGKRRSVHESKFGKYPVLDNLGDPDDNFMKLVGEAQRHQDEVDNKILYSIYKNAANFLVTEDIKLHQKAKKLGLGERVLTASSAVESLKMQIERYVPEHLTIENIEIHNLDLESVFFDDIREDYPKFNDWFIEKSKEGRRCWCWRKKGKQLKALLIYIEKYKTILREKPEKSLKICTFKVSDEVRGLKLGELLLKLCFEYCRRNGILVAYLTIFEEKSQLRVLLEDFGFREVGIKMTTGELIYAKDFLAHKSLDGLEPLEYCKRFFPEFFDGDGVRKFVVPIQPEFHDRLFGDVKGRQTSIDEFEDMIVEQNTIKKAYVCNARITKIRSGDLLLFYRSRKKQGITGIGVVESVLRQPHSFGELISFIKVRSVYSTKELHKLYENGALAILFRYIGQLPSFISRERLYELEALNGPPQSILIMDDKSYKRLKEE